MITKIKHNKFQLRLKLMLIFIGVKLKGKKKIDIRLIKSKKKKEKKLKGLTTLKKFRMIKIKKFKKGMAKIKA